VKLDVIKLEDNNLASTRIRMKAINALRDRHDVRILSPADPVEAPVVFVQKIATKKVFDRLVEASARGVSVVYDVDDEFHVWKDMPLQKNIAQEVADVITVDTDYRKQYVRKFTDKPVFVMPPVIDYIDGPRAKLHAGPVKSVFTFGNNRSVESARQYAQFFKSKDFCHIASSPIISGCRFIPWKLSTFIDNVAGFDVCFLSQFMDTGARKSVNRLLVPLSVGIPAIACDLPSYRKELEELGLQHLVYKDGTEIPGIMDALDDPAERQRVADISQEAVWKKYNAGVVSAVLEKAILKSREMKKP